MIRRALNAIIDVVYGKGPEVSVWTALFLVLMIAIPLLLLVFGDMTEY